MGWPNLDFINPFSNNFLDLGNAVSGLTDAIGLTDTNAGRRGYNAMSQMATNAGNQLDNDMAPVFNMYQNAMAGRPMSSVLDAYDMNMNDEVGAGQSNNVQNYLNPMYQRSIRNATDQALAGAGSSLQSSAANNVVATGVANTVGNMWNTAFNQALQDSKNNQGIYGATMQSNLMPSLNWAQLQSDTAGNRYTRNMDLAQAAGQVSGLNQSWFGNLF